jgi:hypothetical protein
MQWAISKSHESIGMHGEKLSVPIENENDHEAKILGQTAIVDGREVQVVGGGGWGRGVRMVTSDEETQRRNREMLNKFLRKQKRKWEKEQQKQQQQEQLHEEQEAGG